MLQKFRRTYFIHRAAESRGRELVHIVPSEGLEGDLFERHTREVCADAPQDSQVADDQHTPPLSLQLDDHGSDALDHVQIALAAHTGVPIAQFILVAFLEFFGEQLLDLLSMFICIYR